MTREEAINWLDKFYMGSNITDEYGDMVDMQPYEEAFNMAIKALEQEPILDRDCEHCSKTYGTFGCCTTVSNKWVYSCKEGQREYLLDKIKAEIEMYEADCRLQGGTDECEKCNSNVFGSIYRIIDKYKAESEVQDADSR